MVTNLGELEYAIAAWTLGAAQERLSRYDALAHYSTAPAFFSMLDSGEVWLSNVTAMNDYEEVISGARAAWEVLNESNLPPPIFPAQKNIRKAFWSYYNNIHANVFAVCFSGHDDAHHPEGRLSMWRSYASDGEGVCLVLHKNKVIRDGLLDFPIWAAAMIYETEADLKQRVRALIGHISAVVAGSTIVFDEQASEHATNSIAYQLLLAAINHKHIGFVEEHEFRFVHARGLIPINIPDIQFAAVLQGRIVKPVLKLPIRTYSELGNDPTGFQDIIREIIVGPREAAQMQVEAIRLKLSEKGINVPVRSAAIPYRAPR